MIRKHCKQVQERFKLNEDKILEHGQRIQQLIKNGITEHDQQIKKSTTELSGETDNEEGYFVSLIVRTPHRCLYLR
jgi:hypothetical protein